MLNKLIKIANSLDAKGYKEEADQLDFIINKMAGGRFPGMEHEMHSPIEETKEFQDYEAEEEYKQDLESAAKLAELIVKGLGFIDDDEKNAVIDLAYLLSESEHMPTVTAISKFIENQ